MAMSQNKRICFFGCGDAAQVFIRYAKEHAFVFPEEQIVFSDNNSAIWGRNFMGFPVIPPRDIQKENIDSIVISSEKYSDLILNQLVEDYHIPISNIETLSNYRSKKVIDYAYSQRYGNNYASPKFQNSCGKIVVYTAIMGDCDNLKDPEVIDDDITYVCFTNNRKLKSDVWNIEYDNSSESDNRWLAKCYKLFPNRFFKEYDISVWVDGKFQISGSFKNYIEQYGRTQSMLLFPHFYRNCIYEEAAECVSHYMTDTTRIINQIAAYRDEGYPFQEGLYELGCIVRKHHDSQIVLLMDQWMNQQKKYSIRDQISLPYVLWKNNYKPDICDLNINENEWINYVPHKKYV